ncbi:glycoside hydrolase family 2 protein [Tichowtungia aerotolerans]|uniref:Glycoside hydrolase family 2 protein n=1 Tax=Tichowtungia aerotolerans TaxID=2697043 RepID=A0A6P1M5I7_9BACT|nr:glycoside hydrolase family 2 TIM barrel-domain containing protein [Tichowtungia aerotolerans]QHI69117.1 glycoside hydrolase family 2 protein [Tichowtungia aerotolerans]
MTSLNPTEDSGRCVYSFNPGWRFIFGDPDGAEQAGFDDSGWMPVNLPHGLELLPADASGSVNYQGPAWYRKRFSAPAVREGGRSILCFESIMGRSEIYLNGRLVKQHRGGFTPIVVDITDGLNPEGENVIAVCADNSDDPSYPPGKEQCLMDFCYFGGIYRNVWLYTHGAVHITDPHLVDRVAGGGIVAICTSLSNEKAVLSAQVHLKNHGGNKVDGTVNLRLLDSAGTIVARFSQPADFEDEVCCEMDVLNPHMWSPSDPYLYRLQVRVLDREGRVCDGQELSVGLRTIDFNKQQGFVLNGEPYGEKLVGVNRHQDFAYVGNALPDSVHVRDVIKLKDAGANVIRSAHYPQSPAFMDACDRLGLFVIVATPGWQFFNPDPAFREAVYWDVRQMIRRDRNHPSLLAWEPALNETVCPEEFNRQVWEIVHEEMPQRRCYSTCDHHVHPLYCDLIYRHPPTAWRDDFSGAADAAADAAEERCYFTREWGDNVDDWNAHNSPSRVHRSWGELPQLVQALHYAEPSYPYTCLKTIHQAPVEYVGATLWCGFDHQRGYHPDPFYGGLMDAFRQKKYSWYLFRSQRSLLDGPVLFVAHELTPFSGRDIVVFCNCEEVSLSFCGRETVRKKCQPWCDGAPNAPMVFENEFDFMELKKLQRAGRTSEAVLEVKGWVDGRCVISKVRKPALEKEAIVLTVDDCGVPLTADGSDFVTVIASVVDVTGTVKRLNKDVIRFEVEGAGHLVGDGNIGANPRAVEWGTVPVLIRSTGSAGKITVRARPLQAGIRSLRPAEITLESVPPKCPAVGKDAGMEYRHAPVRDYGPARRLVQARLRGVAEQQADFE